MLKECEALKVEGLSVAYHKHIALKELSFILKKGSMMGVVGPNGAGKSTCLKACLGLIPTLSGSVSFFGEAGNLLKAPKDAVAYVPQRNSVDWDFPISALDVVLMGRYRKIGWGRWITKSHKEKALECLERVEMRAYADRPIGQLSGGQQQRVFIARALAQEAEIYFLDEPFAGIDAPTEAIIFDLLKSLQKEGKTILCVHHDLNTVSEYFDYCLLLNRYSIASGPIRTVLTDENLCRTYERPCQVKSFCRNNGVKSKIKTEVKSKPCGR